MNCKYILAIVLSFIYFYALSQDTIPKSKLKPIVRVNVYNKYSRLYPYFYRVGNDTVRVIDAYLKTFPESAIELKKQHIAGHWELVSISVWVAAIIPALCLEANGSNSFHVGQTISTIDVIPLTSCLYFLISNKIHAHRAFKIYNQKALHLTS
jgi:hypothetical protein